MTGETPAVWIMASMCPACPAKAANFLTEGPSETSRMCPSTSWPSFLRLSTVEFRIWREKSAMKSLRPLASRRAAA